MLVFSQGKGLVSHNNPLGLGSLGSKSPLQSPPNVSVPKDLMSGMHTQLMPNTSHPNQLHSTMPMSSIQGKWYWAESLVPFFFFIEFIQLQAKSNPEFKKALLHLLYYIGE